MGVVGVAILDMSAAGGARRAHWGTYGNLDGYLRQAAVGGGVCGSHGGGADLPDLPAPSLGLCGVYLRLLTGLCSPPNREPQRSRSAVATKRATAGAAPTRQRLPEVVPRAEAKPARAAGLSSASSPASAASPGLRPAPCPRAAEGRAAGASDRRGFSAHICRRRETRQFCSAECAFLAWLSSAGARASPARRRARGRQPIPAPPSTLERGRSSLRD